MMQPQEWLGERERVGLRRPRPLGRRRSSRRWSNLLDEASTPASAFQCLGPTQPRSPRLSVAQTVANRVRRTPDFEALHDHPPFFAGFVDRWPRGASRLGPKVPTPKYRHRAWDLRP